MEAQREMKPILLKTEMVRAILEGRKTVAAKRATGSDAFRRMLAWIF